MSPVRIAIFASGTGSNALALIKKAQTLTGVEISFVLSDKAEAPVLAKAQKENVPTILVERKKDRAAQEHEVLEHLHAHKVDWIFLAGYMRLISANFLNQFAAWHNGAPQIVNIHPSLLPAYPGTDSIARAYQDKVKKSGVTIHLVDEGMDTGAVLAQESLELSSTESLEQFATRVHSLEHQMYTGFLQSLVQDRQTVYFEGKK